MTEVKRTGGFRIDQEWVRLTEPNGNAVWANRSQIACIYSVRANDGNGSTKTYTTVVCGGVKLIVVESGDVVLGYTIPAPELKQGEPVSG